MAHNPKKLNVGKVLGRALKAFSNTERSNAESLWDQLAEFITPNSSGMFQGQTSPGIKRTTRLFDSTAQQANQDLAASIHSTLTNPTSQWSRIRFRDDELNNNPEAVAWLEDSNRRIHEALSESNFDTMVSKNYQSFCSLGNMILLQEEMDRESNDAFNGFRFTAWHLSEVAFSENHEGIVDTIYRKYRLTARQAIGRFGKNVSKDIFQAMEDSPEELFTFIHCIFPRDKKEVRLNEAGLGPAKFRPVASIHIEEGAKKLVEEGGYYENPVYVTRWGNMPGEVYGRGPGHVALPEIRTLNRLKEITLDSLARAANPPMLVRQRGVLSTLNLQPGGLTVMRGNLGDGLRELTTTTRFDVANFASNDLADRIKSMFFLDKLFLPSRTETGEMTLGEVQERLAQMQKVLGPTLSRLNNEFLSPLILRSFKMLLRGRALPPIPESIEGDLNLEIRFVNQLARSQQVEDVASIQQWVAGVAQLAQLNPQVLDFVDTDAIAKHTAKLQSVPEVAVTNDDDVAAIREQRAQQQQQQQALEAGVQVADIQSKTGGTGGQQ